MSKESKDPSSLDMYQILIDSSKKSERDKKTQLLESIGVKEFFEDGDIQIDMKTCKGVECQLCIKACPTNALYWKSGEIGIVKELCVFCTSCVWSCIVDGCIKVWRERSDGKVEKFSTPREVLKLLREINLGKRRDRVSSRQEWERKYPSLGKKFSIHNFTILGLK